MPQRHIPERTCVACRSLRPKREMVRVVRTTDGPVRVDPTGKQSGRGAYLCRRPECWQAGLRRKVLDRALKTELSTADREALAAFAEQLSPIDSPQSTSSVERPTLTNQRERAQTPLPSRDVQAEPKHPAIRQPAEG